ncbi:MAG: prolipoprotein diacylglyceryl transferase [Candidatus Coatesbacteria bacterium]|nr:prolipoprotein diacylglyceryl transferase [Candidatus Coatesbacteria bacterium]
MHPILFKIGTFEVGTYGLALSIAFAVGITLAYYRAKREGVNPEHIFNLCVWVILAGILGAKILLIVVDIRYFIENPGELFSVWRLGGVWWGGPLMGAIVAYLYAERRRMKFLKSADIVAPSMALGVAIGRLGGCFMAGCCYGHPTDSALSVVFTNEYSHRIFGTPLNIPVHPTQLYNSAANLINFIILTLIYRKKKFDGQIFLSYVMLYSLGRFLTEFFRGDPRGSLSILSYELSTSQFIGLIAFIIAGISYFLLRRRTTEPV